MDDGVRMKLILERNALRGEIKEITTKRSELAAILRPLKARLVEVRQLLK